MFKLGDNKKLKKRIIVKIIIISISFIFLVTLFLSLSYIYLTTSGKSFNILEIFTLNIWTFLISLILYCLEFLSMFYITRLILKVSPHLRKFIYFSQISLFFIILLNLFAHFLNWYDQAHYFFIPFKYDIISHFTTGIALFLIFILLLSIFNLKYRIENQAFLLTNLFLFLFEVLEFSIDSLSGTSVSLLFMKYVINSSQDLIMNFLGSLFIYFLTKKYLIRKIKIIRFERNF